MRALSVYLFLAQFWARATLFCVGFVTVRWRVVDEGGPYIGANTPRTITLKCVASHS